MNAKGKIEAVAITAMIVISVFGAVMPMIPMAGATDARVNSTSMNTTIMQVYDNITGTNATYENKVVTLNFTIVLNSTYGNITNVTLNFSDFPGIILPATFNATNVTAAQNISQAGFNVSCTNASLTPTVLTLRTNTTTWVTGFGINSTGSLTLKINISNVTMPEVSSDTNFSITISAWNHSNGGTAANNYSIEWLQVRNDDDPPELTNFNMPTLGSTDVVSGPGGIAEVWNVTYNASNPPISFNLNDTLSGVKNGTIKVYIDNNVLLNATINEGNVTMAGAGRNATVNLGTDAYFTAGAAGNLTAGEEHKLWVIAKDNSTNEYNNTAVKTFYVPRIVMGATRTADITANGADPITITVHLLKPDGSIDTSTGSVKFTSDSGVSFDGGSNLLFKDNSNGNVSVLTNFTTSGTHTITAQFNGTTNEITIKTVAVVANVTASAPSTLVANGTDSCNVTLQAVDENGVPVLKSGYNVTITAVSSVEGSSPNISTTIETTDANGRCNYTLTASTTVGEVITITPAIQLADGSWVEGSPIEVTFVSGEPAKMKLYSSEGTPSVSDWNTNLTVTGIVAGNTTTFTANITDANEHPLPGQTVTFTLISGKGTLLNTSAVTDEDGNASIDFTTDLTKGNNVSIINVTVSGNASLFSYIDVSTTNGTADHLILTASPTGLPADGVSNSTVTAKIVDINNNSVTGYDGLANVTFEMAPTNLGNLSASYNLTNASGYAEVNFTAGTTEGTVTITATANVTLPGGNTTTTSITLGKPNKIVLSVDRTNIPTDGSLNATVTAALYKGDMQIGMKGKNITFQLTNGTLYEYTNNSNNGSSITVKTNDTGVAAANVSGSGAVETVQLIVVSPDYPAIDAATQSFTFTGSAVKFTLTNTTPTEPNATGISESTLTVQLLDSAGNKVGATKTVTFTKTNGTLSASVGETNATTGILNVTLSANTTTGPVTSTVTAYISGMTAQSVTVTFPEKAAPAPELMEGDVDMNGCVDISDAMLIAQYDVGLIAFTADQLKCGDTNDDGEVDITDAMHIAQYDVDPDGTLGVLYMPLWNATLDADMLEPVPC